MRCSVWPSYPLGRYIRAGRRTAENPLATRSDHKSNVPDTFDAAVPRLSTSIVLSISHCSRMSRETVWRQDTCKCWRPSPAVKRFFTQRYPQHCRGDYSLLRHTQWFAKLFLSQLASFINISNALLCRIEGASSTFSMFLDIYTTTAGTLT